MSRITSFHQITLLRKPSVEGKEKSTINLRAHSTRTQHSLNHSKVLESHLRDNRTRRKYSSREKRAPKQRASCIF